MDLTYLYQLQGADFASLRRSSFEIAVIDKDDSALTGGQIDQLQKGGQTLLTYLSIGEAEDYRDYWTDGGWSNRPPDFLLRENPDWEGNYRVKFWNDNWQNVVFGQVKDAVRLGYDGIYLDIVDAYKVNAVKHAYRGPDIRQEMIDFVIEISDYARKLDPDFLIVPQNAVELLAISENRPGVPNKAYLAAIDGIGVEDLWYDDNRTAGWTPDDLKFIERAQAAEKFVLATSYPDNGSLQKAFVDKALEAGLVPFVGTRDLDGDLADINRQIHARAERLDLDLPDGKPSTQIKPGMVELWKAGTNGSDHLKGGFGADCLFGRQGNDRLFGRGGNDTLHGGKGFDRLQGGSGHDELYGNVGNDHLFGNDGDDEIYGNAGVDWLWGGRGDDVLVGGPGSDRLYGGSGEDRLVFGKGDTIVDAGWGIDTLAPDGKFTIDLARQAFRPGFEAIDLANGVRNLLYVDRSDILRKAGHDSLFVTGDSHDQIRTDMGEPDDYAKIDGTSYACFESGAAELYVELGLLVNGDVIEWL